MFSRDVKMIPGMLHLGVFTFGVAFNIYILFCCFRRQRWRLLRDIKYLIVAQSTLDIISIGSYLLLTAGYIVIGSAQGGVLYCNVLPTIIVVFVSLAIFNFTAVVITKQVQVMHNWEMRGKGVIIAFLAIFTCTAVIVFPLPVSLGSGLPLVECESCKYPTTLAEKGKYIFPVDVPLYVSWFLVLQFVVPAALILNRLLVLTVHCLKPEGQSTDISFHSKCHRLGYGAANTIAAVVVIITSFYIFARQNVDDSMTSLNKTFFELELFSIIFLCCPMFLLDLIAEELSREDDNTKATSYTEWNESSVKFAENCYRV